MLVSCADGQQIVVECSAFTDVYDAPVTGALRCSQPMLDGTCLVVEKGRFRTAPAALQNITPIRNQVHSSWSDGIAYRHEQLNEDGSVRRTGLRIPQIGALHGIAAHWTLGNDPALVVMPTGTGKTEVMIAAAVESQSNRVLVIVPTDPLRSQTAEKFLSYGWLKRIGIVGDIPTPVVGALSSKHS
jgi:hypothetical protein